MAFSPAAVVSGIRRIFLVIGVSALCGILMAGLALPVVGALGLGARESADWFREMDLDFEPGELSETSRIRDADGKILARFFDENRHYVELDKISETMVDAILAIEDDRFFERGPIDFQGTLRALARNVEAGETQGGGSTLTRVTHSSESSTTMGIAYSASGSKGSYSASGSKTVSAGWEHGWKRSSSGRVYRIQVNYGKYHYKGGSHCTGKYDYFRWLPRWETGAPSSASSSRPNYTNCVKLDKNSEYWSRSRSDG
jgi:hypothetical protein